MFAAVASTSTSSFPVCSAAQKTNCLGSHLLPPLVLHTTMTKKKALTKETKAFAKAQASQIKLAKAHAEVEKAGEAYDKAAKKTKKLQKPAELAVK